MLNTAELRAVLETVDYKAGWLFELRDIDPYQGPYLSIYLRAANSYDPAGGDVLLKIHSPVPPCGDGATFLHWLLWRIKVVEVHETLEWFRVGGRAWIDPHASLDEGDQP